MANQKIEMFKSFINVLKGDKKQTALVIPDMYAKDIYSIDYDFLKQNGFTNLIFDIDNTIMEVNSLEVNEKLKDFFLSLNEKFNVCLVSNNAKERVLPVARVLETNYLYKADKPNEKAFEKALIVLDGNKNDTVMIGDQMLTDIKGAKEFGLYSVLVEPYKDKYDFKTGTSRVLQNIMTKKLEKNNHFKRYNYYQNERS